jgi:hypothetical protein
MPKEEASIIIMKLFTSVKISVAILLAVMDLGHFSSARG